MANRLQKLAVITYVPAVAAQPAVPAYCVSIPVYYPGGTVVVSYNVITDSKGNTRYLPIYETKPAHTEYVTTCYPAKPAVAGRPAVTQYLAINGWNAGANSVAVLKQDGHFEFKVSGAPRGVVIGLSKFNGSNLPSEASHAFYFHGTAVDLLQYGRLVASNVLTHSAGTVYRIVRRGSQITFETDDWSFESDLPSEGGLMLDVALYTSGDYVDDPALVEYNNGATIYGEVPALTGTVADSGGYCFAEGTLPALVGAVAGKKPTVVEGVLPALTGLVSEGSYAIIEGALPALTGELVGGYPTFNIASVQGALPPLNGTVHALTGEVASVDGVLPALTGYAADRPYAFIEGTLPALGGTVSQGLPNNVGKISSPLAIGTLFHPKNIAVDGFSSSLLVGGLFGLTLLARDGFSSTLLLGSIFDGAFDAEDGYSSPLVLGGRFGGGERIDGVLGLLADQPMQLAVNVAGGASTLYLDFAFAGFARSGQDLYAYREDGVYLVGAGDDEGLPLQGLVDFGASEFGTSQIKRAESVYFGLHTDASLALQVETDSGAYEYPVALRGPMARAVTGKGCYGRTWNLALEFTDATYFELDALEVQIGATQRRLRGR